MACQQNAIEMASRWHANNGPPLNAGLVALWSIEDQYQYG